MPMPVMIDLLLLPVLPIDNAIASRLSTAEPTRPPINPPAAAPPAIVPGAVRPQTPNVPAVHTPVAASQLVGIQRQFGNILLELEKHDHLQAARVERTGRLVTAGDHAKEVTAFANGLRNSIVRLKGMMSDQRIDEAVRADAAETMSRMSRLLVLKEKLSGCN